MSGKAPFFLTGANAKIRVNNKTLAFATDISYSVEVKHADPRVLGMYEGHSIEPLAYYISGTFTVIRYVADMKKAIENSGKSAPHSTSNKGNGLGAIGGNDLSFSAGDLGLGNSKSTEVDMSAALNPNRMQNGSGFNIEIYQKMAGGDTMPVARIRGARITRADFAIGGKTSPAIERYAFRAVYVDEDSFLADTSGLGQQNFF